MMLDALQKGWRQPGLINYLFLPLSILYVQLMRIRQGLYAIGLFKSVRIHAPVIVIGGVSVGGNGKTPLVLELVVYLKSKGLSPGVISRGYGGNSTFWPRVADQTTSAEIIGDEPQFIFDKCQVPVMVGPDRVYSACELIDKYGCNVIVSDDGFQHFRLRRDIDIVVIDGQAGFGNGWCLPSGPLREPKSSLKRANIVVLNGEGEKQSGWLQMHMQLAQVCNLETGQLADLKHFCQGRINAVAGIGNPERFFDQLEDCGLDIVRHAFPDHHQFSASDLHFDNDFAVLMTEKDGIKCIQLELKTPCWVVQTNLSVSPELFQIVDKKLTLSHV